MKSVLLSTRPKWCEKICHEIGKDKNGKPIYEKQIEVRKGKPSEVPCRVLIYCTKGIELWGDGSGETWRGICEDEDLQQVFELNPTLTQYNGKVIGEFICDKVIEWKYLLDCIRLSGRTYYISDDDVEKTCLSYKEIVEYGKGKTLYGWHISDLKIYDNPKKLSEFYIPCKKPSCRECDAEREYDVCAVGRRKPITRPPQSYMFVEELIE